MDLQWDELAERARNLRSNFRKFHGFIIDNKEKRVRAMENLKHDSAFRLEKTRECEKLLHKIALMKHNKTVMDQKIKEYRLYQIYLNQVVDAADPTFGFKGPDDVVRLFETYANARDFLAGKRELNVELLEELTHQFVSVFFFMGWYDHRFGFQKKLIKENDLVLMGIYNYLGDLRRQFDEVSTKARRWENTVLQVKENMSRRLNEIVMVRWSVWNTYKLLSDRKKSVMKLSKDDVENQLVSIKKTLADLRYLQEKLEENISKSAAKKQSSNKQIARK